MLITGIKSRPTYDVLTPFADGIVHLVVGQGSGGSAMLRLLSDFTPTDRVEIFYSTQSFTGQNHLPALEAARGNWTITVAASNQELIALLEARLDAAIMGTRLYLAGSESFIGEAMKTASRYDLNRDEVKREHCGSLVRRVWCVHCDSMSEDITQRVFTCTGCSRSLIVRDHYSRYLGAFMGVQADAEVPGELPEASLLDT